MDNRGQHKRPRDESDENQGAEDTEEADVDADEEVVDASGTAPEDETPGDSVRKLEIEILYSDEPNWDEINSKAAQVGRDTPWVQRLKEKRINTQVALDQVRHDSPIETSTAEIIRHIALRSNPLLVCPQVESAKTHAEVLGIDPGAAEDAKARSFRQLGLLLHPDRNQGAPDRFAKRLDLAFKKANDAKDANDLNDTVPRTRTEPQRNKDEKRREKQARARKAADDLSDRATAFQREASRSVRGDDRSRAGITPWARTSCEGLPAHLKHLKNVVVQFVKVHATKVPAFGTILKTEAGSDVALLPTKENTLVLEAGCSSEKTRQFCTWMKSFLLEYPDMPVLCVTCRKTHADDLWATAKNFGLVFTNYLDAKGKGETKTEYMRKAKRLIVSLQSLHLIDLALYDKGILFMDEIRSIMSIPGGSTLPTPTLQLHGALRQLCRTVSFRVCMDADVSADGAVETALRIIARDFDVLHVQLQEPALKRRLCISFGGEGSNGNEGGTQKFQSRLKLWLLRVRWMGDGWCKKQKAKMQVASVVLWLLEKQWAKQDSERGGPPAAQVSNDREAQRKLLRKRSSAEDIVRMCALTWLLRVRERQWLRENEIDGQNDDVDAHREVLRTRLCQRIRAARYDRQRVLVCCGTPIEASSVAEMCEAMGVRYHVYSGSTSDQEKRDHFKNTTDHWWEASVIIATSTMTVAVNVQIHFSVTFLWFRRAEAAGRLRELFQGLVRVARNEQDPLEDERIFMLMPGKMPDCSKAVLMRSQKQRFNDVLRDLKGLNTTSTECDKAAEELVGGSFVPEQEHLGDPLLELIAWNRLEGLDNCGDRALVKVLELCKLQTRGWSVELMKSLTDEDQAEREKLEKQDCPTHDEDDADRAEDRLVGQLSMAEKYGWLMRFFIKRAEASVAKRADELEDPPSPEQQKQLVADAIVHEVNTFVSEQEWLRVSKDARPDKNAREIAKEKLFKLLEPIGFPRSPYELPAKVVGKLASDDTLNKLQWRAAATTIPLDEQRKMHEWMRRRGMTANSMVITQGHVKSKLLADLAAVLKLPIDRLLSPGEFTTEDAWVQVHNRRARGDRFHERADKTCVESVRKIATKMGAKVTFQMSLQTILSHVLSSVLKMSPSKRVEHKMECGAHVSKDGRATQLESWGVEDEWIDLLPKIVLPLLRPDGRLERSVKQQDWLARFEQLQNEAEENARQWDDMEVDEEEQLDDDLRAGGSDPSQPGPQGFARPPFNNYSKVEKYDVKSIQATLADLEIDEAERGQCKEEVFNKLAAQRQQLGPADGFMAAGIVILATNENDEKCVLLAKEHRAGYDKLNFIGGKCEGKETPCETAGRAAFEKCAGLLSQHDRDRFESDPQAVLTECWIGHSKYMLFVMELSTPSIPTLVRLELVPLRNLLDTNWTRSNLYSFCRAQLELVSPWLQKYLEQGSPPPPMTSVQPPPAELAACKERLEKLEQWYHSLLRCDGMHAILENINSAAASTTLKADGRLHREVEYEHSGVGGRRYAKGEPITRVHGDHRDRTATLPGMYSDLRAVAVGRKGYDVDCENGDFRLIVSLAKQLKCTDMIPDVIRYVEHRQSWLRDIQNLHSVDKNTAKRLPNIVSNGGGYRTWLDQNNLPSIPRHQWYQPVLMMQKNLLAFRKFLFEHPRFKSMVDLERNRLKRETTKTAFGIDASLMSRIVQTCEDEVLTIIDRTMYNIGWDTLALVFDGLIIEPAPDVNSSCGVKEAMALAEEACRASGWDIKLADKPLHGLQDETPRSVTQAREAVRAYNAWKTQVA